MNSKYQQIVPKNKLLQGLIKLYYVHQSVDRDTIEKITYYPNYSTTLNIYKHSKVTWDAFSRTHQEDSSSKFLKLLVGKFDRSREIIMDGAYNKLTIVFHPLGINHFLSHPLSHLIKDHFSFFDYFGESFDERLAQVYHTTDIERKRDLLDDYFYSKYIGFKENRLSSSVAKILETCGDVLIKQLAIELEISRKTLLRLFKTHLSLSPSEYKSIVKFRKALDTYQNKAKIKNLSSLAYQVNYYDQSDLNFYFKEKTGLTPKQLFAKIQLIAKELYWNVEYVPKVQDKEN